MAELKEVLNALKIVPVLTVESSDEAVNVCKALQAGGINGVEITLRTTVALDAMKAVLDSVPDFIVGAGTVKTPRDIEMLKKLGVAFAVSPGLTKTLSECAFDHQLPFLPGVATPSEVITGMELGRNFFKLFPAEAVGGIPLLKSLAAPFQEIKFCPTGGVSPENLMDYLGLPNVLCVGGSWMVPPKLIKEQQWERIRELTRQSMAVVSGGHV